MNKGPRLKAQSALPFNPKPSTIMHLDINSCFATIEQQANPFLRNRPIAVAAYTGPSGCIIAPSVEAKELGVKTGMRVKDGLLLCPDLTILPADPWKYRDAHQKFKKILKTYTDRLVPKSIDEFVLNMEGCPSFSRGMFAVGWEIKSRIKEEIGEWIRVSIGIGPNRFCAKMAAGLKKPDGLEEINKDNYLDIYSGLKLEDLHGVAERNAARLHSAGIHSVTEMVEADLLALRSAFQSVNAYYWYLRLRGWEIDDVEFGRRSFGNSYALPKPLVTPVELAPILVKLVEKTGRRMRKGGYRARGVHVAISYRDGTHWHKGRKSSKSLFDSRDIYKEAYHLLCRSPYRKPVSILAESCFDLVKIGYSQGELFDDVPRRECLVSAVDSLNERWGDFVITPARMLEAMDSVPDRIAFGGVKELEEFALLA